MLVEMKSPVFIEKGKERPPIKFKEGLNRRNIKECRK